MSDRKILMLIRTNVVIIRWLYLSQVFKGYVDDPRNTDNAWMETVACNFHDEDGTTVGRIPLNAGDDARAVRWLTIDKPLQLYASHSSFVEAVCTKRGAYFARLTK